MQHWLSAIATLLLLPPLISSPSLLLSGFPVLRIAVISTVQEAPHWVLKRFPPLSLPSLSDDLRQLSEEVLDLLRSTVGSAQLAPALNSARQAARERTLQRRKAAKMGALLDPQRNAQRKASLLKKKQHQKRRKIDAYRRMNGR